MKICHLTTVHPRNDIRVFYKMCKSIAEINVEISLIVADGKGDDTVDQVNIIDVGSYQSSRFKRLFVAQRKMLQTALELNADCYQLHDPELLKIAPKLKRRGKKVIYDSHEDVPKQILYKKWLGPLFMRKIISKVYDWYEKNTVLKLDGLISVIEEITEKFKCPNMITIKNYPIVEEYQAHVKINDNRKKKIIYVGSISEERGIMDYLDAMKKLKSDFTLVLVGSFSSIQLKEKCLNHPAWREVEYLGFQPMEEVVKLLGECFMGLCVLHPEQNYLTSLPTKGFEYASAQLPMIMSNFDYWRDYFEGTCIFVQPKNSDGILKAIETLINDHSKYEAIQKTQFNRSKIYSWENEAKKLKGFYDKIVSS